MYTHTPTVCNHLLTFINKHNFQELLGQHQTDKRAKKFSTRQTFVTLFVAQVLGCGSIREISTKLGAHHNKLYHLGLPRHIPRSTFSDWINKIPPIVFQSLFFHLLGQVKQAIHLCKEAKIFENVYAIDSTLISLTLSVFNWAHYRKKKGGIKLHVRLNLGSALPDMMVLTEGKKNDGPMLESVIEDLGKGDIIVMDRGYLDYATWYRLHLRGIVFVTRTKKNTQYCPVEENVISHYRVTYDSLVEFINPKAVNDFPDKLRVVRYIDEESGEEYEYITNHFELSAEDIVELYRRRREIETLFRWLKQNLKIKEFLGTSSNAVENQVRVALCYYLIVKLIQVNTNTKDSMLDLTRKFQMLLFERVHLLYVIGNAPGKVKKLAEPPPMISLFQY